MLLNLALVHLGFYLGYLSPDNQTTVATVHIVGYLAGLALLWLLFERVKGPLKSLFSQFELSSEALISLSLIALGIGGAAIFITPHLTTQPWTTIESFAFSSALCALFFPLKDVSIRWFYTRCTFLPDDRPKIARRIDTQGGITEREVAASDIRTGDVLRIKEGETVVADCIVLSGLCEVSERKLSGQSLTRVKGEGDTIFASSSVVQGSVDCKVQALPEESYITSFAGSVRKNLDALVKGYNAKSEIEKNVYRISLFVGTVAAVFWYGSGKGMSFALSVFGASLLVTVIPFGLLMEAFIRRRALLMAYAHGILFKQFAPTVDALSEVDVFALDYNAKAPIGQLQVEAFELIDERVDRHALISVLISIFGRSDEDFHTTATQFLRAQVENVRLYSITSLDVYEDPAMPLHGIGALIEGIEFTIGSEELLVARGVQLQASEVPDEDSGHLSVYVAMQDEAVARFSLVPRFVYEGKKLVSDLKTSRVRPVLCSEDTSDAVQPVAEIISIDLPDTFPGLFGDRYAEKIQSLRPVAFLTNKLTPPAIVQKADVSIGIFDEYRWDIESVDVTLFNNDLSRISALIDLAKNVKKTLVENYRFGLIITGFLLICSASGLIDPAVIALSSLFAVFYVYFHGAYSVEKL